MKFGINNPAWLQAAGSAEKANRLFYITSYADGNEISFANTKLGVFADNVQYSTDNAVTWEQLSDDLTITLNNGETVYFRNATGQVYNSAMSNKIITTSDDYAVGGDITALFYPGVALPIYAFKDAFDGDEFIIDASALILKSKTLAEYCYDSMFNGCTSLTAAPALPATALAEYCYDFMFYGCTSLTAITCLATSNIDAATKNWLSDVAAEGTFTKAAGVEWPEGVSGIPEGWTVVEA